MDNILITSAKIVKKSTCTIVFNSQKKDGKHNLTDESESPVHNDLLESFKKLVPHLIIIGEFSSIPSHKLLLTPEAFKELSESEQDEIMEELAAFNCTAFHIQKGGESVILSGNKKLQSGRVFNFVLPLQTLDESYSRSEDLLECIENTSKEVILYMNGKSSQVAMDFGNVENSETVINEVGEIVEGIKKSENQTSKFEYGEKPEKPKAKTPTLLKPNLKKEVKKNPFEKSA